jgi:hypothetical protein
MAAQPEVIRSEIERSREELAYDIDRLADRTSPRRIARRRWNSVRDRLGDARDRVMGVSHEARERVEETAGEVREAPERLARATQGSPVAAGLIAFGTGLLVASLLPETDAERRLAHEVVDRAQGLAEPLQEEGRQLASDMGDSVRDAASEVKETAAQAVRETARAT